MKYEHTETDLPLENEYPKLIRDRIPEIIVANGQNASIQTITDDDELLAYLLKKIREEAQEVASSQTDSNLVEEIADLREVIDTILALRGISIAEVDAVQSEKRTKRGGFEKRLIMLAKSI
jgi:predicted house-cleaning noncanonical NTP pyrophosphatase (MazG superfamily)